jgi:hypothetical protein
MCEEIITIVFPNDAYDFKNDYNDFPISLPSFFGKNGYIY